jgi:hypothetical protein
MDLLLRLVWVLLAAFPALAQSVRIYSEFQRVDPFGNIVAADRSLKPREIISPAVARNGFASFHIAVTGPPKMNYFLYVLANPDDVLRFTVYREEYRRQGDAWIPDALQAVRLPGFGVIPEATVNIPGQTTRSYLLDIWVPRNVPPRRVRVEVLIKVGGWIVAPMEVRVVPATVPDLVPGPPVSLPPRDRIADTFALGPLVDYLSGIVRDYPREPRTVRDVIRRNAAQDMALARAYSKTVLLEITFMALEEHVGAEWYLRLRDFLYRN